MSDQNQSEISALVQKNVENIKTRLIATNKLLTYVHQTKTEYEAREQLVKQLQQDLAKVKVQVQEKQKQCDDLTTQVQSLTNSKNDQLANNKKISELVQKAALAEEGKQKAEDALRGQKMYIEQLEAQSREFEDLKKSTAANKKMTDKERNEINKKNDDLRKAQKELALKDEKISEQQKEIEELQGAKEKLEDDAMEYSLNTEMMQNDIQELKEESNKMETRLEHFINENTALNKENSQLKAQIKSMSENIKKLEEKVAQTPAPATDTAPLALTSPVMGSMSPKQIPRRDYTTTLEQNSDSNSLKTALYYAEAECEIAKSENKFLKAKLMRLIARQRSNEDERGRSNNLRHSIQRPTEISNLLSPPTHYNASPTSPSSPLSSSFMLDNYLQNDHSAYHHHHQQQQQQRPAQAHHDEHQYDSTFVSPLATTAAPSAVHGRSRSPQDSFSSATEPYPHRQHHHSPTTTPTAVEHTQKETQPLSKEKAILQSKSGLIMPPSSVTLPSQKTKPSSSNHSKASKLAKFVKNPSKYATQSSSIPLTAVAGSNASSALVPRAVPPEIPVPKDPAQPSTVSARKASTSAPLPKVSTTSPTLRKTSESASDSVSSPIIASNKHARSEEDDEEDIEITDIDEKETRGKKLKINESIETIIDRMLKSKKIGSKEDLEQYTTKEGSIELVAEIIGIYRHIKSTANPMPKTGKTVILKQFGIKNSVMVAVPDNLDKKEKSIAWFLRVLVVQCPETDICSLLKQRLQFHILNLLEPKKSDAVVYRLIRLLTSICKETYDKKFIYRLCFDICRSCEVDNHVLTSVLNVAFIWNDGGLAISPLPELREKGIQMVLRTIQTVTAYISNKEGADDSTKSLYLAITKLAKWPEVEGNVDLYKEVEAISDVFNVKFIQEVHGASGLFEDLRISIIKCLEMLFFYINDWKTTYDKYIRNVLWPMLNEDVVDDIALELLGVLGKFGSEEADQTGLNDIKGRMNQLVEMGDSIPDEYKQLQVTAKKSIAMLNSAPPVQPPSWA